VLILSYRIDICIILILIVFLQAIGPALLTVVLHPMAIVTYNAGFLKILYMHLMTCST